MSFWTEVAIFYAVAGFVIGGMVSAMDNVNANFRGHPIPFPRVFAGVVAGIIWPAIIWQMVAPRRNIQ